MNGNRLFKGRVDDALQALKGACAGFERSINTSLNDESLDAESFENEKKKRKLEETPAETIQRLKDEVIRLESRIVFLEAAKDVQSPLFERDLLENENKILELNKQLQAALKGKETALAELKKCSEDLEREKEQAAECKTFLNREMQQVRSRLEELEKTNKELEYSKENESFSDQSRKSSDEKQIFELKKELIEAQREADEGKAKIELFEGSLNEKNEQYDKVFNELTRLTDENNELRFVINQNQWAENLVENGQALEEKMKIMAQWETELIELRKENEVLRSDRSNVSLMREKLLIMDTLKQNVDKTRERCAELECDLNVSKQLCSDWEECFVNLDPALDSPEAVIKRLKKLQDSELCLVEENAKMKVQLEGFRTGQQLTSEDLKNMKRLERKLKLITQERDSYKSVLDSYESDVTINPVSMQSKRVTQLETALAEYRKLTDELEANGCQRTKETTTTMTQTESTEDLGTQPSNLRILHFIRNPLDIAHDARKEHLSKIEEENVRLRAKIQSLEVGAADTTVSAVIQDDPRKLRSELEMAKKRQDRILSAFKKTSKEFRQAVYCLTGYRMDMTSNRCVLRHVYAESPDEQLEFEIGENGFLHLLGNDYSLKLEDLTKDYLEKMDSIPAFLAALTLRLFNSQTFMQMEQPSMFVH